MVNVLLAGDPIEMNAVYAINLINSLGFTVLFCIHTAINFMK